MSGAFATKLEVAHENVIEEHHCFGGECAILGCAKGKHIHAGAAEGVDDIVLRLLRMDAPPRDLTQWKAMLDRFPGLCVVLAHMGGFRQWEAARQLLVGRNIYLDTAYTIGQLDEKQLFYLRSRGIGAAAARDLLTYAFAGEIIDKITVAPLRARLDELLLSRLPIDLRLAHEPAVT